MIECWISFEYERKAVKYGSVCYLSVLCLFVWMLSLLYGMPMPSLCIDCGTLEEGKWKSWIISVRVTILGLL